MTRIDLIRINSCSSRLHKLAFINSFHIDHDVIIVGAEPTGGMYTYVLSKKEMNLPAACCREIHSVHFIIGNSIINFAPLPSSLRA